ncbi:dephospho-CoA kinase [Mucisphaera calidilacus]|uniref:Dephospho-CoA kinase n=1 Tax=Mucisphaera calidilacus TaxID=2527982 RepID=A0A518BYR3_9BACT|nr:dephospho-CoA kinase [Mucisphaera calidilacus]QDU72106.1 Dephospho-CoA kinase [Mucisphaera calidilacus]
MTGSDGLTSGRFRGSQPVIGLMGAPGSGKSEVARALTGEGCAVIDADVLAREALEHPEVVAVLRSWLGEGVVDGEGRVDRGAVGAVVFGDEASRRRLEGLIHPRVHAERARLRSGYVGDPGVVAIVEDCPLLLETGLDGECDVLVFVDAPRSVREERVYRTRGWSAAELALREGAQIGLDIKRERADYVIVNDADPEHCRVQSRRVLSQILSSCSSE